MAGFGAWACVRGDGGVDVLMECFPGERGVGALIRGSLCRRLRCRVFPIGIQDTRPVVGVRKIAVGTETSPSCSAGERD